MGDVNVVADDPRENQRMNESLPEWLLNTGILQFGYFVSEGKVAPVRFCPEYLPAYPKLLSEMGRLALSQFTVAQVDHLIANADSLPLGLICSLETDLSLVYSRGTGEAAVYDLVGSYNSGHICTLLVNSIDNATAIQKFISNARSVGLEIQSIVTLFEVKPIKQQAAIPVRSVLRLVDVVPQLVESGRLSEGQAQAVLRWISED